MIFDPYWLGLALVLMAAHIASCMLVGISQQGSKASQGSRLSFMAHFCQDTKVLLVSILFLLFAWENSSLLSVLIVATTLTAVLWMGGDLLVKLISNLPERTSQATSNRVESTAN